MKTVEEFVSGTGFEPFEFEFTKEHPEGWYGSKLFKFGDYCGSYVEQANIEAIRYYMEKGTAPVGRLVEIPYSDGLIRNEIGATLPPLVIILSAAYWSEIVLFNLPAIREHHPELWEALEVLDHYPVLHDDILTETREKRIKDTWQSYELDDLLHEIYEHSPDKALVEFDDWSSRVLSTFGSDDLLEMWRGYYQEDPEENYYDGDYFIVHEEGRNVYFMIERESWRNGEKVMELTPPFMRMIRETALYTDDEGAKVMAQNPETTPA